MFYRICFSQLHNAHYRKVSQTLQRMANVDLGSVRFRLIKRGQHLELVIIFASLFLVYLHHPRACSIIPRIRLFGPSAPRERSVGKSECHWWRTWLRARMCTCSSPSPPWTTTTSLTCVPSMWAWSPCQGLAWSPLGPYILTTWPSNPRLSQTWTTPHQGARLSSGRRPT
jgi:hypothetical protein